jgi:glycerophosphoryl diester phosphodiesterase
MATEAASMNSAPLMPVQRLLAASRILVIAHRGSSREAPENTLPAIRRAVEQGADLVELDYRESSDGELVAVHDETADRTSDARHALGRKHVPIASLSLAELRRLDFGSWFGPSFAGTRIPTLREALDAAGATPLLIERKAGSAAGLVRSLAEAGAAERAIVQSFDWPFLVECRRLAPHLPLAALGEKKVTSRRLAELPKGVASMAGWDHRALGRTEIERLRSRGLTVWAYTVNELGRARELVEAGVRGIITDVPAAMMAACRKA